MSGLTRQLRADEVDYLWPAVRGTHVFGSAEELAAFRDAQPWRVRVSERGDVLLVERWRDHLDVLSIRALVASPKRVGELVDDACAVARSQGLSRLLSPLVVDPAREYVLAGMEPMLRIVAFIARAGSLTTASHCGAAMAAGVRLRCAIASDLAGLTALDKECFDEFWRQGEPELGDDLSNSRVVVAEDEEGHVVGYSTAIRRGSSVTLGRLAVAPSVRRRGVGRALVGDVDRWAHAQGALGLSLCTQEGNETARALYESSGFDEAPGRYLMLHRPS